MRGGYKIINFKNVNINVDDDAVEIKGIYEQLESNYYKATLCDGLVIDNMQRNARFVSFGVSQSKYIGTFSIDGDVFVLTIEISSDDKVKIIKQ